MSVENNAVSQTRCQWSDFKTKSRDIVYYQYIYIYTAIFLDVFAWNFTFKLVKI